MKLKKSILSVLLALSTLTSLFAFAIPASAADAQVPEVLGASMRLDDGSAFGGSQGLRFVARVKKTGATTLLTGNDANFGIILIPQMALPSEGTISMATEKIVTTPAKNLMSKGRVEAIGLTYDDSYYYFNAILTGMPEEFYTSNILARAYVKTGASSYTYSEGNTSRSVAQIAAAITADAGASTVAKSFAATVTTAANAVGSDIMIDFADVWDYTKAYDSSALQNTLRKLYVDKKLNVGYLGGSITVGVGIGNSYSGAGDMQLRRDTLSWRGLTTNWLKNNFPFATINETNAAIGGTGSCFGAFRAYNHLNYADSSKTPDLLFVEFCINDTYDRNTNSDGSATQNVGSVASAQQKYFETIIRELRAVNPYADFVFVLTTDSDQLATDFSSKVNIKAVAETYGIPCIDVGKMLCESQNLTSATAWNNSGLFADIVHPTVEANALYGGYVTSYLDTQLKTGDFNPYVRTAKTMPAKTYNAMENTWFNNFSGIGSNKVGFTEYNGSTLDEKSYLKTNTNNSKISFTFNGTGAYLWAYARTTASTITVSVDGGSAKTMTVSRGGSDGNTLYTLCSGLSAGNHTVVITATSVPSDSSKALSLMGLCLEGNANRPNVVFNSVS